MKPKSKAPRLFLAATCGLLFSSLLAQAATFTWDGGPGGTGTVLNDNPNWSPDYDDSVAPTFSWDGTLAGPLALTINNVFGPTGVGNGMIWSIAGTQTGNITVTNSSSGTSRNLYVMSGTSLSIASGAGAFTLGGSGDAMQFRLSNGTNNYSFINNSINKAILGSNVSFNRDVVSANPSLIFNGSGNMDVLGTIGNLGTGNVFKNGTGTLTLGGTNTFTGSLLVQNGTVVFSALTNLGGGTSAIRIGQTTTNAALLFNGASDVSINRQINIGNGANAADDGSSTIQNDSLTGNLTFGNAIFNVAGTADVNRSLTLRGTNTGNNLISGSIGDNIGANATVNLIKRDAGTWNLTGNNTFSRGLQIWEGVLEFDGNDSLGAQTIQTRIGRTSTDGTLRHTGASDTIVTGQMQVGFGNLGVGNGTIESTGVGTLSFNNATFNNAEGAAGVNRTLTLGGNNTGLNTISGAIVNNNDTNARIAITKTGTGTWVLGGNNTYTGNTTVSDGSLVLANTGRLRFNIGATGVNNTLNGTGTATLNGGFIFNLASAGVTTGNSWNIVNVATLSEGYGGSFSVSSTLGPFTNSSGTWTRSENSVTYQFVQSTGVLSVISGGANYSTWASAFSSPALSNTASTADPDNDGLINAVEYALGLDPRFSSPSPGVISNAGKTITFTKGAEAKVDPKVTYQIETSISLGVAPTPWAVNVADVTNGPDTISITFAAGPVKNFARLKITLAP